MSSIMDDSTIELLYPRKWGLTLGILFLSVIDPEITMEGTFTPLITKYVCKNRITI